MKSLTGQECLGLARKMGEAARQIKDDAVDMVCDEHGTSDDVRRELKKVNKITAR